MKKILGAGLIGLLVFSPAHLAAAKKTAVITVSANELRVAPIKGSPILFEPGRNRRSAHYVTYRFRNEEFREKVGDPQKVANVKIKVEILYTRKYTRQPSDPNAQAPVGGFQYTEHRCRIVKVY